MTKPNTTTDIATLPPAERAVIVLDSSKTEEHLKELVKKSAEITAVESKDAREQAHRVGMELKNARTTIQKTGKTAREDATAFSSAVIAEEKRLIAITAEEEARVLALRDEYDAKLAAEKAAAEAAEKARKDEILSKIQGIRNLPLELAHASSDEIKGERDALAEFQPDATVFAEFMEDLQHAIEDTIAAMDALYNRVMAAETAQAALAAERKALEEERARMAAEREEMERMRAEMAAMKAMQAAAQEAVATGTGMMSVSATEDGAIEVEHVTAADMFAEPTQETATEDAPDFYMPSDGEVVDAEFEIAPVAIDLDAEEVAEPVSFEVRSFALATAAQFDALADKCDACGAAAFATELRAVSYGLREGDHDRVIADADVQALKDADNRLIDATVNAIDAWGEIAQAAE